MTPSPDLSGCSVPGFADEYVSSSRSLGLPAATASSEGPRLPGHGPAPPTVPGVPPPAHPPTKLVIRHGGAGGSPSVTWARAASASLSSPSLSSSSSAASSLDADEDGPMPSRNRPPIKTYEARSRIGLKLKIKQEAGLSKVVHNTALDPVHQPPPAAGQVNGTAERAPPAAERKPPGPGTGPGPGPGPGPGAHGPRLPLRKTYRENVGARADEATGGLIRELAAVEDELAQRLRKAAPPEPAAPGAPASGPGWDAAPAPPAKRRKSESPDVDQASFSSDSPQDDALTEHLQSAIDSILNLQQPPGRPGPHPAAPAPASPPPLHRPEAFPPSSRNGGLGPTRTLNR